MISRDVAGMNKALASLGPVFVYLKEYQLVHNHLHIILTDEKFNWLGEINMPDCLSIFGPTVGGPWLLEFSDVDEGGQPAKRLSSKMGEFVVNSLNAQVTVPARKPRKGP